MLLKCSWRSLFKILINNIVIKPLLLYTVIDWPWTQQRNCVAVKTSIPKPKHMLWTYSKENNCASIKINWTSLVVAYIFEQITDELYNAKDIVVEETLIMHIFTTKQTINRRTLTLNRLSCKTFLIATNSPVSHSFAWKTTPKLPLPMTFVSVYDTSWTRSAPWPGVATTVVTFDPSLPAAPEMKKKK